MTGQDKLSLKCPRTAQGDLSRVCQHKDFVSIFCHMEIRQKTTIITKRYHKAKWYRLKDGRGKGANPFLYVIVLLNPS